jgi:hypothetical protein
MSTRFTILVCIKSAEGENVEKKYLLRKAPSLEVMLTTLKLIPLE